MPVALKEIVVEDFKGQNVDGKEMKRTKKLERVIVTLAILLGSVPSVCVYACLTIKRKRP
ncbi:hypothetical protein CHS0354_025752 [Potamilus streckersoni]|uniref:Uncharacterized protein n=1 Tax=Potamilus streckersoni TaxID=2493646 RepID=A0AAE0RUQ8_9BIVA|nr:hypothetical protein CHS0354_025752 [Potamilus streckersoni]